PTIDCIFDVTAGTKIAGLWVTRRSHGTVFEGAGFTGFWKGIVAQNNSEVVARGGVCSGIENWAVHSRHSSNVNARGMDLTDCAGIAAYADRVAIIDARTADMSQTGSQQGTGISAQHGSMVCAHGA